MSAAIERVEASWRAFNEAVDGVPAERMTEPGASGAWSVKDVLAHVAVWDDIQVDKIELKKNRAPLPEWDGFQAINDREHAARSGWSLEQARAEMLAAHERVVSALRTVVDIDPEEVKDDTWGHYDEHAAAIRAWLMA
ncbi:MAG TPA: DinB family protein [Thermomicrobiales bacterium]|nr:DinB family protein [Thermomicrobiales bacterium]